MLYFFRSDFIERNTAESKGTKDTNADSIRGHGSCGLATYRNFDKDCLRAFGGFPGTFCKLVGRFDVQAVDPDLLSRGENRVNDINVIDSEDFGVNVKGSLSKTPVS